jgi:hypothetical protein
MCVCLDEKDNTELANTQLTSPHNHSSVAMINKAPLTSQGTVLKIVYLHFYMQIGNSDGRFKWSSQQYHTKLYVVEIQNAGRTSYLHV